jgi:hypothetical protein
MYLKYDKANDPRAHVTKTTCSLNVAAMCVMFFDLGRNTLAPIPTNQAMPVQENLGGSILAKMGQLSLILSSPSH